ncbi:MAG: redoxin domain-containing protein [Bacteroidota bacterium]
MIQEMDLLPDWEVTTLDGSPAPSLHDFRGKVVLLLIFSRGCPGCMGRAVPYSKSLLADFPDLQIIGIHTQFEGPEYSQRQIEEVKLYFKLPYPLLVDQGKKTFEKYAAEGTPHWLLVDREGRLLKSFFGSMEGARQRLVYSLTELFES